ncbi:MAG: UDP-2,3-diacylglucosamine diphosphatase [Pseudomonadota bacterium]
MRTTQHTVADTPRLPGFRSLWLSDVHLGTASSRAHELLALLDTVSVQRIYLVGDIIDILRMRQRPLFPDAHLRVIARLVQLAASGTEVIYVPGNHDAEFRGLAGRDICGISVRLEAEHTTAAGQRLLILHGDTLDPQVRQGTNLERFGAAAYNFILGADAAINQLRRRFGKDSFPISAAIKRRIRSANEYIARFEITTARHARERGFDGVVCGHIHRPAIRMIDGCLYANDGDWVEHGTVLAEDAAGVLQLLDWRGDPVASEAPNLAA